MNCVQILVGFGFNSDEHLEAQLLLGEWLQQQNKAKYHFLNVTFLWNKNNKAKEFDLFEGLSCTSSEVFDGFFQHLEQ